METGFPKRSCFIKYLETQSIQLETIASLAVAFSEVEFSNLTGPIKSTFNIGVIGLERLGNPTIDTALLGQNLSFVTPGQESAVGGVLGAGIQYRPRANVSLFIAGEGTALSDRSYSGSGTGGVRVSF